MTCSGVRGGLLWLQAGKPDQFCLVILTDVPPYIHQLKWAVDNTDSYLWRLICCL